MSDASQLRAYLRLHLAAGVGAVLFRRLLDAFGDAESVLSAGPQQWRQVEGIGAKTAAAMASVREADADAELAEADKHGVRIICMADADFPAALKTLYDCPPVLYIRGRVGPADAVAVGIVGSRRCTHYGLEQAERFGQLLAAAGFTVVSGGARGIDTAAHRGALAADGRTVAVMGCGLCQSYPAENARLFDGIVAEGRGAVISELPMKTTPLAGHFPTRNRIISGMSLGVVIVEAGKRSGALITAREAAEQGRAVFAVPGRLDSPLSRGTHELIRDGAVLVQGLEDVLEQLGEVGVKMTVPDAPAEPVSVSGLNQTQQKLLDVLAGASLSLDELADRTGLDSGAATAAMTMLVLKGAVRQMPGNVFARRLSRPTAQ